MSENVKVYLRFKLLEKFPILIIKDENEQIFHTYNGEVKFASCFHDEKQLICNAFVSWLLTVNMIQRVNYRHHKIEPSPFKIPCDLHVHL